MSHNFHRDFISIWFFYAGKVTFIDQEYGMYNYQPFDIGNHFCEYAGKSHPRNKNGHNKSHWIKNISPYVISRSKFWNFHVPYFSMNCDYSISVTVYRYRRCDRLLAVSWQRLSAAMDTWVLAGVVQTDWGSRSDWRGRQEDVLWGEQVCTGNGAYSQCDIHLIFLHIFFLNLHSPTTGACC